MRRLVVIALLVLLTIPSLGGVFAQECNVTILHQTHIRQQPSVRGRWAMPPLLTLDAGTRVTAQWREVLEPLESKWYYVDAGAASGWLHGRFVDESDCLSSLPAVADEEGMREFLVTRTDPPSMQAITRSPQGLRVRSEPSPDAEHIGSIPVYSTVTLLGTARQSEDFTWWVYVRENETGLVGWVTSYWVTWVWGEPAAWNNYLPVLIEDYPGTTRFAF